MSLHFNFTVGRKIYAIIALSFVGFLGVTYYEMNERARGLENQKQQQLQYLTDLALGIVKEEHASTQGGKVAVDEAKKRAAARIGTMRYAQDEYFWINDMSPVMVMHPTKPALDGKSLSDFKDPNGKRLFVEFVDVVKRSGSGFVDYEWPKPGAAKPQPKLSYVAGFTPWGWVIGTGVYVDDLTQQTWTATQRSLLITAFVLVISLVVSVLVAPQMARAMHALVAAMGELAPGKFDVVLPGLGRRDEVGVMARGGRGLQSSRRSKRAQPRPRRSDGGSASRRPSNARPRCTSSPTVFEAAVGDIVDAVSVGIDRAGSVGADIDADRRDDAALSGTVAAASEQASVQCANGRLGDRGARLVGAGDRPPGARVRAASRSKPSSRPTRPISASTICRRRPAASATW